MYTVEATSSHSDNPGRELANERVTSHQVCQSAPDVVLQSGIFRPAAEVFADKQNPRGAGGTTLTTWQGDEGNWIEVWLEINGP